MKESSLAYSMDLILTLPAFLPAITHLPVWNLAPTAFSLLAHTWCTNVAAMPVPVYLLGHELKHVYGYFPLNPSMGLACVVVSYNGRITITLITDQAIIRDADILEHYLHEAYYDLAGGIPERKVPDAVKASNDMKSNGTMVESSKAIPVIDAIRLVTDPLEQPATIFTSESHKLFSEDWAKALQEEINHSENYRSVSLSWTAGSLAFVMEAAPNHGFASSTAVWLDLYRGVCRSARALSVQQAMREAVFVIQGAYVTWMDVLSGKGAPLVMLTNGRLKLKKGALLRLLPHTRSAGELVRCAQRIPLTGEGT
jgi:putative sterol carrier protein